MGGSSRAGGRARRSGQGGGTTTARDVSAEATAAEGPAEATGTKRGGAKRAANTKKTAATPGSTSVDKNARGKESQRKRSRSGGAPAGDEATETVTEAARGTAEVAGILPVREDEEQWTPEELEEVRTELEQEVAALRREIERTESEIADRLRDPSDGAGDDQADTGAKTFEREHEMSLANNARDLLGQNERAIVRIGAGTYGVCEICGNPIGKARLQAFPRAALCVTCKQREERR